MRKIAIVAAGALALTTAVAYAQMQHSHSGQTQQQGMGHGMMGHGHMMAQQRGMGPGHMGQGHSGQGHSGQRHSGAGHMMGHGMQHGRTASGHDTHAAAQPKGDTGPSSLALHGVNQKMHAAMNIAFTGDADADFVRGMIPHHQGAVEMAKVVLAFGKDPAVRKLAEEIVKAQETEIALMQSWLKQRGQ
jgi:hypothetical protein